jgi:hypothetical protein
MSELLDPDSSNGSFSSMSITPNFFEGTEKLLEVWFYRADGDYDHADLRKIPR